MRWSAPGLTRGARQRRRPPSRWCWCCRRASATRRARCSPARSRAARRRSRGRLPGATTRAPNRAKPIWRASPARSASLSKHKCRVFWTAPLDGPADAGAGRAMAQRRCAAPDRRRPLPQPSRPVRLGSHRSGLAPAGRAPAGATWPAQAADLGAGYGYLAGGTAVALPRHHGARSVRSRGARARSGARQPRAVRRSRRARLPLARRHHAAWPSSYDFIVSNPPFHAQGRADRPDIGRALHRRRRRRRCSPAAGCGWSPIATCRTRRCSTRSFGQRAHRRAGRRLQGDRGGQGAPRPSTPSARRRQGQEPRMKLVKLIANLGYGSRKDVAAMFREGRITDAARRGAVRRRQGRPRRHPRRRRAARSARRPDADAAQADRLHLFDQGSGPHHLRPAAAAFPPALAAAVDASAGSIATPAACC